MATIAVFVALGGTGYAALQLPKASVGAKHLRKNAVTGKKVKNGSLGRRDFALGQIPAGPKGDKGAPGDKGEAGAAGAPGSARAYTYLKENTCGNPGPCTLDSSETKGFSGARRTGVGVYCIAISPGAGINRDGAAVLTTIDWSATTGPEGNAVALAQESNTDCLSNEIRIRTQRHSDTAPAAQADFISFFVAIP